jgi:hypothetical protein
MVARTTPRRVLARRVTYIGLIAMVSLVAWMVWHELRLEHNKRLVYESAKDRNAAMVYSFEGISSDYRLVREWLRLFLPKRYFSSPESVAITVDSDDDLDFLDAIYDLKKIRICCGEIPQKFLSKMDSYPLLNDVMFITPKLSASDLKVLASKRLPSGFRLECSEFETGSLQHLNQTECPISVTLCGTEPTAESLKELASCNQLRFLTLKECPVTDADLQHLHGSKARVGFSLLGTEIKDHGILKLRNANPTWTLRLRTPTGPVKQLEQLECTIPSIEEMPKATSVAFLGHNITDAMLSTLREAKALTHLQFIFCDITDEGLLEVGVIQGLKQIFIVGCDISDDGLKVLEENTSLEKLEFRLEQVDGTAFADFPTSLKVIAANFPGTNSAWVKELSRFQDLEILQIYGHCPDEEFFEIVQKLPKLKELKFEGFCISPTELVALRKALPNCSVLGSE